MRLLWTLMGTSAAYEFFAGLAEAVPALLLLFRRTATLGALLGAGAMLNVVLLNFSFDVPVKIYSTTLFLIAVVIASGDAPRLLPLFVLNKPADAAPLVSAVLPKHPRVRLALKVALIALLFGPIVYGHLNRGPREAAPAWVGWYQVNAFDGPSTRKWVAAELTRNFFFVERADRTKDRFVIRSFDNGKLALSDRFRDAPVSSPELQAELNGGELKLSGELAGDKISATLKRTDPPAFLLTNRGFHWVSEVPYNR